MPSLTINTNVPKSKVPENFLSEMSSIVAASVGKPEKYVCVYINPDQMMCWEGTSEPCALCRLECIGKISEEENKKHNQALMDKIHADLGIPKDRMYITFVDLERPNVGWNGKTFAS